MRFMMIVKATKDSEAGVMPGNDLISAMTKYNEQLIMHAYLRNGPVALMAPDRWGDHPFQVGNNFSICVAPESLAEPEKLFAALGEKGTVIMALQDTFWGARFGTLADQFGINWMFNFEKPK